MLNPDDLSEFLSGNRGSTMEFGYFNSPKRVTIFRDSENDLTVRIPTDGVRNTDPFDIRNALDPLKFSIEGSPSEEVFCVRINTRHQLRSVLAISKIHLGWDNADSETFVFY